MSGGYRFPFTASQWQELEHQALFFKYMASGLPIPPDLLLSIKRSSLDSSNLFSRPPQNLGWNSFQMGLGKKFDPEPDRCRRTDGKKWRCSKEAYQDSKYCERHMHRGKNRSRKPVEVLTSAAATPPSTAEDHHQPYPFLYKPHENPTHPLLDSTSNFSKTNIDFRRLSSGVDERAFFSESSGGMRSFSGSESWQLSPTLSSSSSLNQRSGENSYLQLQGNEFDQSQKTVHRFFDEMPPNRRDSWLDLDDKSPNKASRLSISIPSPSHEFSSIFK